MQIFFNIVNLLGVIGVWVFVFWFGHSIKNLKSITGSMKSVFDAMKSSSEYSANVQSIVQKLYDPAEVEKVVNLRVQAKELELLNKVRVAEKEAAQAKGTVAVLQTQQEHLIPALKEEVVNEVLQKHLEPFVRFVCYATWLLDVTKMDLILGEFKDPEAKARVTKFVYDLRMEIDKVQRRKSI